MQTLTVKDDFIRVSDAKQRYFGGSMSLRWWYKQIELGRLPHLRTGFHATLGASYG